jgi:light-regulated signal transduction histidine kinase (bacteriophytochrome)
VNTFSPSFGQADLTNCERELIHLTGSIQPHGVLLVLDGPDGRVIQASANAGALVGATLNDVLGRRCRCWRRPWRRPCSRRWAVPPVLADAIVQSVRDLTGYDRVMVYRFDPDGHGKIVAEARDPRLESLLGHHYPASDIPQRARELYLKNRVRMLVDVNYEPQPLVPPLRPGHG